MRKGYKTYKWVAPDGHVEYYEMKLRWKTRIVMAWRRLW